MKQKVGAWVRVTSCMREVCEICVGVFVLLVFVSLFYMCFSVSGAVFGAVFGFFLG